MSKKPDYRVGCLDKQTDAKGNIGAAWINDDGTISIVIDAFVVIRGGKQTLITLFPEKAKS
jgi:hypothetical protein